MAAMIGGALANAFAFTGSSYLFRVLFDDTERKRHDLAIEQLQKDRDEWNQKRLQQLDYVNEKLREEAQSERQFKNVNDALQEYYYITGTSLRRDGIPYPELGAEPQLEDYIDETHLSALQTGELVVISTGILLSGYLAFKYF